MIPLLDLNINCRLYLASISTHSDSSSGKDFRLDEIGVRNVSGLQLIVWCNPLTNDKILDASKLKQIANDI